jgi:hypothetical protein
MINIIILADELKEGIFKYYQNTALLRGACCHNAPQVVDETKNIFNKQADKADSRP